MSTEGLEIRVSGLAVRVVRKDIKNLHLGVYPPLGRVRVAVPLRVSDAAVRLAVSGKLGWIRKQQAKFAAQPRQTAREMVSGESHYFLGRRYRLRVVESARPKGVVQRHSGTLDLHVGAKSTIEDRERLLQCWYRARLRELVPLLLGKWEKKLGVHAVDWRIKRMKTKWGACSIGARRIWLNLELAKKPVQCLEYLIAHELMHLIEPHHDDAFVALMDRHLPQWRHVRKVLNEAPLGHADWSY